MSALASSGRCLSRPFSAASVRRTPVRKSTTDASCGAAIWCPPELWLREAWRLLRPGGKLVFLGNHPISLICSPLDGAPCDRVLHRPYRGMWGADWTEVPLEPSGICFNLTVSGWMALFSEIGFVVRNYQEVYAPDWASGTRSAVPAEWAKQYPLEQVWHVAKPDGVA